MGKVIVLEVCQFTSTGQVFDLNKIGPNVKRSNLGWVGFHTILREVFENSSPMIGYVWYRSDESGKMILWKSNYDSSG